MNYQHKTKDERTKKLQKLQQENNSLKTLCTKDITEHEWAEQDLQNSEARFMALIEFSSDVITVMDAQGTILYQSPNYVNIWGRDPSGEIGKDYFKDVHPDDKPLIEDAFIRLHRNPKESVNLEVRALHTDNTWRTLDITGHNHLENPALRGIVVNFHDITKRKRAEEERQVALTKYKTLFDCFPFGITVSDEAGKILEANQTAEKLLGVSLAEHKELDIDSPEWHLVHPDGTPMPPDEYASVRALKDKRIVENAVMGILKPDNTTTWLSVTAAPLSIKEFGVVITYNDITEQKQAEEEIRKSAKLMGDLHMHVNEIREEERAITSREIHDQIGQSLTALKIDLNWMHEYINTNPEGIAKIQGMIELVKSTIKAVQRISSELRPGILDDLGLAAAIEWYCDEFERRTSVKCNLKLDDSAIGDSQKNLVFFRVLQEALTNVIRHAKASSVTVKLHHAQKGTTLTIHDNGIGIPEEKIKSYKSLGLIGIRERVRLFNGKVDISSKKDNGTKLTIRIPS